MSPPDFSHLKPSDRVKRVPRVGDVVPVYADGSGGRAQVVRADPDPTRPGFFKFYMDRDWSTTRVATGWSGDWEILLWPAEMFGVVPPTGTTKLEGVLTCDLCVGDVLLGNRSPRSPGTWNDWREAKVVSAPACRAVRGIHGNLWAFKVEASSKADYPTKVGEVWEEEQYEDLSWTVLRPDAGLKPAAVKLTYVPPTGDPDFPVFCVLCKGHSYIGMNAVEHKPGHGKGCPAR